MAELHHSTGKFALHDIILGGQDGLVNVLGLVLGLAAAGSSKHVILAGGLAATFAESISMAAVAYTSKFAERDRYQAERQHEADEMRQTPELEMAEIQQIFYRKGFRGKLLNSITKHITNDPDLWLDTMMADELGLAEISPAEIYRESSIVGISTLIGSLLPLLSFFFLPDQPALIIALIISALALLGVGAYKAATTVGQPAKGAIQMMLIGLGAALAGYLIGLLFR